MSKKIKCLIVLILVFVIILLSYFILKNNVDNVNNSVKKTKEEKKEKIDEVIDENLDEIGKILLGKINKYSPDQFDVYGDITFDENLSNEQLIAMLYYFWYDKQQDIIDNEDIDNYFKDLYNVKLSEYPDIICPNDNIPLVKYNSNLNIYNQNPEHLGHGSDYVKPIYRKINSIEKKDDNYILSLNKLYSGSILSGENGIYTDALEENKITSFDKFYNNYGQLNVSELINYYDNNYDSFKNLKPQYKYTFKKSENDYYLSKYEIIK